MRIRTQEIYHGAVLTQITEHPSFTALNKVDSLYGHYLVNHETRLFVKYLSKQNSPWHFKFSDTELQSIQSDLDLSGNVYLCLVCGQETICALNKQEFFELIDVTSSEGQMITVEIPPGGYSMRVKGSVGNLDNTIRHNSFPEKLFADESIELME